jgi:hypothetical protein
VIRASTWLGFCAWNLVLFSTYGYKYYNPTAGVDSRAAYARPGGAGCFFAATITQQQLTAAQPMPGQAVLAAFLQLLLLNSSSQQSSLCQASAMLLFSAAIIQ